MKYVGASDGIANGGGAGAAVGDSSQAGAADLFPCPGGDGLVLEGGGTGDLRAVSGQGDDDIGACTDGEYGSHWCRIDRHRHLARGGSTCRAGDGDLEDIAACYHAADGGGDGAAVGDGGRIGTADLCPGSGSEGRILYGSGSCELDAVGRQGDGNIGACANGECDDRGGIDRHRNLGAGGLSYIVRSGEFEYISSLRQSADRARGGFGIAESGCIGAADLCPLVAGDAARGRGRTGECCAAGRQGDSDIAACADRGGRLGGSTAVVDDDIITAAFVLQQPLVNILSRAVGDTGYTRGSIGRSPASMPRGVEDGFQGLRVGASAVDLVDPGDGGRLGDRGVVQVVCSPYRHVVLDNLSYGTRTGRGGSGYYYYAGNPVVAGRACIIPGDTAAHAQARHVYLGSVYAVVIYTVIDQVVEGCDLVSPTGPLVELGRNDDEFEGFAVDGDRVGEISVYPIVHLIVDLHGRTVPQHGGQGGGAAVAYLAYPMDEDEKRVALAAAVVAGGQRGIETSNKVVDRSGCMGRQRTLLGVKEAWYQEGNCQAQRCRAKQFVQLFHVMTF